MTRLFMFVVMMTFPSWSGAKLIETGVMPLTPPPKNVELSFANQQYRQWQSNFIYQAVTNYNLGLLRMRHTIYQRPDGSHILQVLCEQISSDCDSPKAVLLSYYRPVLPSSVLMKLVGLAKFGGHRAVVQGFNWFHLPCDGERCDETYVDREDPSVTHRLAWFNNPAESVNALIEHLLADRHTEAMRVWNTYPDKTVEMVTVDVAEQARWAFSTYSAEKLYKYDAEFFAYVEGLPMAQWESTQMALAVK